MDCVFFLGRSKKSYLIYCLACVNLKLKTVSHTFFFSQRLIAFLYCFMPENQPTNILTTVKSCNVDAIHCSKTDIVLFFAL